MRRSLGALAMGVGLVSAGAACAAPTVQIDNSVVRVIVSPEPRADIKVDIVKTNPRLPLRVWTFLGQTHVDGGFAGRRVRDCRGPATQPSAYVVGVGEVSADAMPQIIIHTPMDARVRAGGAVFGQVGRSASLDLADGGCGAWQVGNVRGRLKVSVAGSGEVRAGHAGAAELMAAGSGAIMTREVDGPVAAMNVGSGDIEVASVRGPLNARIAGSGHVRVAAGHASVMQASIAGSGDIALAGVADSLRVSVVGSGDVRVTRVTGPVSKAIVGSGEVRIGS
jgi:Putative auto-transporter adhesin, head GIN domain